MGNRHTDFFLIVFYIISIVILLMILSEFMVKFNDKYFKTKKNCNFVANNHIII
jgi:hypothetical protein